MFNITWTHEIDDTNCDVVVTINGVTETCSMIHGSYYGLSWYSSENYLSADCLLKALATAIGTHSESTGSAGARASRDGNVHSSDELTYPHAYLLFQVYTAGCNATIQWTNAATSAVPTDYGFPEGANPTVTAIYHYCYIPMTINWGFHWTPLYGSDNVALDINRSIVGSQAVAGGSSDESAFVTRVLGTIQSGSAIYDVVPDGYIRTYRNTEPGASFSAAAHRDPIDEQNTLEKLIAAASGNKTFRIIKNQETYINVKISPPWDISAMATYTAGGRMYCGVTINFRIVD